jgi:hypothetical protein
MPLVLATSLTRREDGFASADPARVTLSVCGPTVYVVAPGGWSCGRLPHRDRAADESVRIVQGAGG